MREQEKKKTNIPHLQDAYHHLVDPTSDQNQNQRISQVLQKEGENQGHLNSFHVRFG